MSRGPIEAYQHVTERRAGIAGDAHDDKAQEEPQTAQDNGHEQAQEDQPQVSGTDREKLVAERDEKIAALESQVAEAAKNAEAAEQLRGEIAELKAQGESDRIDFRLQLAGVLNVKAARAILADHGDVNALKEAEPWPFADAPAKQQGGKAGLPNAGTSTDAGKTMRRWCKLAGLDDSNDKA
ncbi:hypothetical protein [Collinsella bouchesdurhonensis]|uniref:hypothetical protein n=1 Tax=Collinsella bouchesdurhonensis TaxID=1907654 RepID=UPI0015F2C640|nr:hypothetical protein [Collinsella bouchesdurhonensis]